MTHSVLSRRLATLSACALALVVGACGASNGAEPIETFTIEGIGVLPAQSPLTGGGGASGAGPSVPDSILTTNEIEQLQITDNRVFLEGDSVMRGMAIGNPDALDLYVASLGWKLTVDAEVGRFTDEGVSEMKRRSTEVHQVVVAMLGNNYYGDVARFAGEITDMLESFPDVRLFVMFTVPEFEPAQREVNDVLRLAAGADDRLVLIDWERMSREIDGVMTSDGVHPTSYGADVLAQAIGLTLGLAPGAGPDVTLPTLGSPTRPVLAAGVDTNKGENSAGVSANAPRATTTTAVRTPVTTIAPTTTAAPATTRAPSATNPATTRPAGTTPATATTSTTPATTTVPGSSTSTTAAATTTPTSTTAAPSTTTTASTTTTTTTTTVAPTSTSTP